MLRLAVIAAVLAALAFLAPHADAAPESQGHHGQVTINVTPAHGQPFGFRAPAFRPFRGVACGPWCFPPIVAPVLPPPVVAFPVPVSVAVPVPVAAPVPVPVAAPVAVPVAAPYPVAVPAPSYAPALPVAAPCGCAQ